MKPPRPCLDCGIPTRNPGSRCRPHQLAWDRVRNHKPDRRLYSGTYQAFRKQALAHATNCARCGTTLIRSKTSPAGATYDHATDSVLCRSCNSSRRRDIP